MIRLDPNPPPEDADSIREEELTRIRRDFIARGSLPTSDDFGTLYNGRGEHKPWRSRLRQRQHNKCAFCESKEQERFRTIEHIRPKAAARRRDGTTAPGYWWLAWTWENLVFCCSGCNSDKNNSYPLARGGRPLIPEEQPPGDERPLLVNPRTESAIDSIQFKQISGASPFSWRPYPRDNDPRGYWTIRVYGLARDELLDSYGWWVRDVLHDELEALRHGDSDALRSRWDRLIRRFLICPDQPFRGLTYDVLDQTFPARLRQRRGLHLPKP